MIVIRLLNLTRRSEVGANDRAVIRQREGRWAVGGGRRDGIGWGWGQPDGEAESLFADGVGNRVILKGFVESALQRHAGGKGNTWNGEVAKPSSLPHPYANPLSQPPNPFPYSSLPLSLPHHPLPSLAPSLSLSPTLLTSHALPSRQDRSGS